MRIVLSLAAASAVALAGCGGLGKKSTATPAGAAGGAAGDSDDFRVPKVDESLCDAASKRVAMYDLNQDKRPDVWKLYSQQDDKGTTHEVMTCKQVDLDHDGKKDYVARFDESGAIVTEDYDFDFDSMFDARTHYDKKTGKKYLVERVTSFEKRPDVWEKYDANEVIESVRRDMNRDGKPDVWEHYRAGALRQIQYDDDGDGMVDRQEEVKQPAPPTQAPTPAPEQPAGPAPAAPANG